MSNTASSILVLTEAKENVELRLAHLLGGHDATSPFVLNCENYISSGDPASFLRSVIDHPPAWNQLFSLDHIVNNDLTSLGPGDGTVGVFTLIVSLLDQVMDPLTAGELSRALATSVESYIFPPKSAFPVPITIPSDSILTETKMTMLCALYNLRSAPKEKCWILGRILGLAGSCEDERVLFGLLPGRRSTLGNLLECDNLIGLLERDFAKGPLPGEEEKTSEDTADGVGYNALDGSDRRVLYRIAAHVVGVVADRCRSKGGNMDKEAELADSVRQTYLLKLLDTYSSLSDVDTEAIEAAKAAATGAIRDPVTLFREQGGMMTLPPIQALEDNSSTKPLHFLLKIFQEGKLEDYQSFLSTHTESALTDLSLDPSACTYNIRLLSLCSLATEHEEIPYDAIASTLQVTNDEVESWVIAAVSSGLLSAKMDQLQRVVMVERCVLRKFGMEEWKSLQQRLHVWKENVATIVEGLKQGQIIAQQ
eukprot:CAMPEP_0184862768 /NCGR_PEP_ID=MMETSP0580-20130426/7636_1 /TAXON_ID=1118495 /ORGANISM="Dactyliosolen fragilissimus" /LENGTH=479 /DNA_ID=CAMNT_0027360747 /DNA_START=45 /DNA_END=1484 /DNA_ORIENTATION=+